MILLAGPSSGLVQNVTVGPYGNVVVFQFGKVAIGVENALGRGDTVDVDQYDQSPEGHDFVVIGQPFW